MENRIRFALNRIIQPSLPLSDFILLAAECRVSGIELRNDLPDPSVLGGEAPDGIRSMCADLELEILSINALQRFNDPALLHSNKEALLDLIEEAVSVGCRSIVLCPVNDPGDSRRDAALHDDLMEVLHVITPLLRQSGIAGLVEPLGFAGSSLRFKKSALRAISDAGCSDQISLLHDTFHHYLSEEDSLFPAQTGLIHVSGVTTTRAERHIVDADRVLVDHRDVMSSSRQIEELLSGGYAGMISFEPFSPMIQTMKPDRIRKLVTDSIAYLTEKSDSSKGIGPDSSITPQSERGLQSEQ